MFNAVIVGAGYAARNYYAKALPTLGVKIVGVTNRTPQHGKVLAEELGVEYFTGIDALPTDANVNIAFIATSTESHVSEVKKAIKKNIPYIFCEKPLGINSKEAAEICRMSEEAGAVLGVGYKMRYEPVFAQALNCVKNGEIGMPMEVSINFYQAIPHSSWYLDSGCMHEMMCHIIDITNGVVRGEPAEVYCTAVTRLTGAGEDAATIVVQYTNGMRATINGGWLNDYPFVSGRKNITFLIAGTGGYICGVRPDRLIICNEDGQRDIPIETKDPIELEVKDFIKRIEAKEKPTVDAYDAQRVHNILEAADTSRMQRRPVSLAMTI